MVVGARTLGRVLHLYDTATRSVRELALREPGKVSIYVCGPTVYGPAHIGHGRATLTYDILRRYFEWSGLEVRFVSNITDIEDKIIERAKREDRPWQDITTKCEAMWFRAMDGIGVQRPTDIPHATEYVEQMVEMIGELIERDEAYMTDDGVYMDVESVDDYGALAFQSLEDMRAGGGEREVVGAAQKRHPADFVLWKFAEARSDPAWPSPWGDGRPGWHSECVVMSLDLLGEGFDLHCGGQDLRFPHHENERAQAVALGKTFANHWMHNGFVVDAEGEKMSKSIGNVSNLLDLIEHYDPRAYRLVLLQSHYRSPVKLGQAAIDQAVASLAGLDAFAARLPVWRQPSPTPKCSSVPGCDGRRSRHTQGDGAGVRHGRAGERSDRRRRRRRRCARRRRVRDLRGARPRAVGRRCDVPDDVAAKAAALDQARAEKDYAAADTIRAELQADGWTVETTKDGTAVRR